MTWGSDKRDWKAICEEQRRQLAALEAALEPFAVYAEKRLAMPLNSLGDSVHMIHGGTEWEAEIKFSHCLTALDVLGRGK